MTSVMGICLLLMMPTSTLQLEQIYVQTPTAVAATYTYLQLESSCVQKTREP